MDGKLIRALLVEDNPTDVLLLRETLAEIASAQFELTHVERLSEALRRLSGGHFDVVLLDLGLPDSEGLDTFVRARENAPGLPIVVLTGLDDEVAAVQALQNGGQDYLVKGQVGGRELVRSMRYAIERGRAEEALRAKDEEIRAMTQQLWQSARLATMGELAASIAHELNNPLATVSLRVESLLAGLPEGDPNRRALGVIEGEVERMGNLVASLLQFSRRSGQQISSVDVREEVRNTLELIHYHLRNRRIAVAQEFAPDAPVIQADRQQLRQLFLNLFTNASDAMPEGGTLTIRLRIADHNPGRSTGSSPHPGLQNEKSKHSYSEIRNPKSEIVIEVADTGAGIAPEHLSRVMEPFFTTKEEGKGTGLGLAICRRIAQEHHGTLEIESEVGKGTTVRVTLPVSNGANAKVLMEA